MQAVEEGILWFFITLLAVGLGIGAALITWSVVRRWISAALGWWRLFWGMFR